MSEFTFGLAASPWIVAAIVAAAFAFAVVTYRQTRPEVSTSRRWLLIGLRTLAIGLLLIAIFEPALSFLDVRADEPSVLVAVDDSESMTLGGQDSSRIAEARGILRRIVGSELGERTDVAVFADTVHGVAMPVPYESLTAKGPATRLDGPFALLSDSLRRKNVRAIVLLTDGRYNSGSNPLFEAEQLGVPVYAVGLGDSVEPRDLSVQQVFTNDIAYVGSDLPVEVRIKSSGYPSGLASVTLRDDAGIVASQQVALAPGTNEYTTSFVYRPRSEGMARLRADIAGSGGELTSRNNTRSTFVRVRSDKRRYVILSGAPSPDLAFIRRTLERDRNITLTTLVERAGGTFLGGTLSPALLRDAEALILIGYPTAATTDAVLSSVRGALAGGSLSLFVVMGASTDAARLETLEAFLPVTIGQGRGNEMQVFADLTESAPTHPGMHVSNPEAWRALPPIFRSETQIAARAEADVLAWARLGSTRLDEPLIVARRLGHSRSMMVAGYGLFRWQLLGEGPRELRGEAAPGVLDEFIGNAMRWLGTIDDERRVRIATTKQLYNLGEPVRFHAQVYDDNFDPISDATVTVDVGGPGGRRTQTLAVSGNGRYEGTLTDLPAGDYSFDGRATRAGVEIGRDGGRFVIGEIGLEFLQPAMNAELLRALAQRTGGRFYTARESGTLLDDIRRESGFTPRSVESERELALWSNPWVLAAAIAAFVAEWTMRKRSGML
ncbi:MAG TPA: hypothetical protein VNA88_19135 [Candidatus Kapabacteria bacterium]|nr:hypothetical protein [Candidatus Kapabacteria bacterium]